MKISLKQTLVGGIGKRVSYLLKGVINLNEHEIPNFWTGNALAAPEKIRRFESPLLAY